MKDSDVSTFSSGLLIGFFLGVALLVIIMMVEDCKTEQARSSRARETQRCDVQGRSLGCIQDTAWAIGDTCSCSLPVGTRITFTRDLQ